MGAAAHLAQDALPLQLVEIAVDRHGADVEHARQVLHRDERLRQHELRDLACAVCGTARRSPRVSGAVLTIERGSSPPLSLDSA